MPLHVVVAGGGTAGHIEPALNVADALRTLDPSITVSALGTAEGLETRLVPARGYELDVIARVPLPRRPSADLLSLPWRLRTAVAETRAILEDRNTDVLVGFGGYVAMPAYLAARKRMPIVIHEANARAGLANRVGRRFTPYVAEAVAGSLPGAIRVGIPLRASVASLDRGAARAQARRFWSVPDEAPCLLVFGGSQGARRINEAVVGAVPALVQSGIHVIHAFGEKNADQITVEDPAYHAVAYIDDMSQAYSAADFAITRAGAMTCAELAAVGLPALYVPLPIGNGEQKLNAEPTVRAGGGRLVEDKDLTAAVVESLASTVRDPAMVRQMSERAAGQGVRDASERVADLVLAAATGRQR